MRVSRIRQHTVLPLTLVTVRSYIAIHKTLTAFFFHHKMDRPSLEPLELLDQIEREFSLPTYAVNWPIGSGDTFQGVVRVSGFPKSGDTVSAAPL